MIVIFSRLSQKQATFAFKGITQWFKDHPKRRTCQTEHFAVRRGHIAEDILQHSQKGVKLPEGKKTEE
jgi:hypothetical protein